MVPGPVLTYVTEIPVLFEFTQITELMWPALTAQQHSFCRKCFMPYHLPWRLTAWRPVDKVSKTLSNLNAISSLLYVTEVSIHLTQLWLSES